MFGSCLNPGSWMWIHASIMIIGINKGEGKLLTKKCYSNLHIKLNKNNLHQEPS